MGRRGPAPQPRKLKILKGQTAPSQIGPPDPQPPEVTPEPPEWLGAEARTVWRRTVRNLEAMGLAYDADTDALVVYCNAVVDFARAQQDLDRNGILIPGERGTVRNPANTIVNHTATLIGRFAREFGLTPSARTSLPAPGKPAEEPRDLMAG
jgi:P27 family predicted phage terminase small subunit